MSNKENIQNSLSFKEESNYKNLILLLHDRLKRHLSSEYISVSERKDALESDMLEMKFELEQKDKKLFKTSNQRDTRRYFSPLNLEGIEEDQKDERMKQLTSDVERLNAEIDQCEAKMTEIKDLLLDIDEIQDKWNQETK